MKTIFTFFFLNTLLVHVIFSASKFNAFVLIYVNMSILILNPIIIVGHFNSFVRKNNKKKYLTLNRV